MKIIAAVSVSLAVLLVPACSDHGNQTHNESYNQGHSTAHDFFSIPANRDQQQQNIRDGYNDTLACKVWAIGPHPTDANDFNDWVNGCVDAMRELGLNP